MPIMELPKIELITPETANFDKRNIAFIGFMGAGKSTIGKVLAKKTGLHFVDIDRLIERETNMNINSIFNLYGESYFRDIEESVLKRVLSNEFQIISCGGGVVIRETNRIMLKEHAINCWLYNSPEVSISRIKHSNRPLLATENPTETAKILMEQRAQLYYDVANYRLNTEQYAIDQISQLFYEITYKTILSQR